MGGAIDQPLLCIRLCFCATQGTLTSRWRIEVRTVCLRLGHSHPLLVAPSSTTVHSHRIGIRECVPMHAGIASFLPWSFLVPCLGADMGHQRLRLLHLLGVGVVARLANHVEVRSEGDELGFGSGFHLGFSVRWARRREDPVIRSNRIDRTTADLCEASYCGVPHGTLSYR